jgi:hypothetical protein
LNIYSFPVLTCLFPVRDPFVGETEILLRIIRLDIIKIREYLKDLRTAKGLFEETVSAVESRIITASSLAASPTPQSFLEWFGHVFMIRDLPVDPEPEVLLDHIRWAQKAKRYYLDFLKAAFSTEAQPLPRWVRTVFKLGRYGIASRALVQLASELPALVNPMTVEPVIAPPKTRFTILEEEMPLTCVLRRVVGDDRVEEFVPRLASIWNTTDAESYFRRACSQDQVVHAEMQLVNFYEHNQQFKPTFRFIGVSKKSCYLCHLFLATHPESFCVSSCHQKLYLSWIPPPAADSKVYKRYKAMTVQLSKVMEATAKQDLGGRLGTMRRPVPADSTAGVSLSGLTTQEDMVMAVESQSSFHTTEVISLAHANAEIDPAIPTETEPPYPAGMLSENSDLNPFSAMVFHFMRLSDVSRQDIISIDDILDHSTGRPSWAKLVEFLKIDDGFGLAFKEAHEFLMVNNRIRVGNERQLLACLLFLRNSEVLNSEVFVCTSDEAASLTPTGHNIGEQPHPAKRPRRAKNTNSSVNKTLTR